MAEHGSDDRTADEREPRSKVARVIDTYDLDIGGELQRRWLATDETGMSLRELAAYFNQTVLEAAIEQSDLSALNVDVERLYEQLTNDNVSAGARTRAQRRLERNGVDVESLRSNFVTHQAIHTYLREYRDVQQPDPTPEQRRESTVERIQKLQDRTAAVTQDAVEGLQRADLVSDGDVEVMVDIQVIFADSGEQFDVFDLIESDAK